MRSMRRSRSLHFRSRKYLRPMWAFVLLACFSTSGSGDDCNRNGRDDAEDIDNGFSEDCNQNRIPDECEVTDSLLFETPARYITLGRPHTGDIGDLDGDGDLDVVTGNRGQGIVVLINEGDGSFARPTKYSVNSFTLVTADFDNDGALDIASSPSSGQVHVLKNRGDGTYERQVSYSFGGNNRHLTAGDLDSDGFADIIASSLPTNEITLIFNSGDGTFGRSETIGVVSRPVAAVTSDLDTDGDIDIAVSNAGSSVVSVLENTGDGTFKEGIDYPVSGRPEFVAAGDLDLDGHIDLVTANVVIANVAGSVSVFWNQGDGTFNPAVDFPVDQVPFSVIVPDLNGDGSLDIAVTDQANDRFSILLNQGGRLFTLSNELSIADQPRFLVAGDLDADDDTDLVSINHASGNIAVFLNKTPLSADDYLERICTEADFFRISIPSRSANPQERVTKFILPERDNPALLPTVFQNARRFSFHEEFLRRVFPQRFGNLTPEEYDELVGRRATRDYYAGAIRRVMPGGPEDGPFYTFSAVADTGFDFEEVLRVDEIERVYETLSQSFQLGPLLYEPDTELARREAETWQDPPFEVFFPDGASSIEYEPYTLATGYGRVRLLTLQEFNDANQSGRFTFQDILVVDLAPRDIEGVVAGVITAERQGDLSHVAIRTARRGTPNAFVADAMTVLAPYEGKLVRLEVLETEYLLTDEVTLEEAEAFWAAHQPSLPKLPDLDKEYQALDHLLELDLSGAEVAPVARYGGKASNLARLQHILLESEYEKYRLEGFAIPMHYYVDFMVTNTVQIDGRTLTYQEYLTELLSSPEVETDSQVRFQALDQFRDFVRQNGVVDPELLQRLADKIVEVFGSATTMVRFRSSSNMEDTLVFNGAGLYESTSVCVEDSFDLDSFGPSHCDPQNDNERTIERALKKVWSSLWTFRAYEERQFFQIPQELAAMGILCNRTFLHELVNGVAFTGSQRNIQDKRYVVTAQIFEESVVSPEPGVSPERDILEVVDGQVLDIIRDRSSSLVPPGETVLSDPQLRELGALMWHIDQNFPIDLEAHERQEVVLDLEFKIDEDGSLAVKQVRPFLIATSASKTPTFELEIPPGTEVCGVFSTERTGREPRVEYEAKSTVRFVDGTVELPTGAGTFSRDLIQEVRFGPDQVLAEAQERGKFRILKIPQGGGETIYRFNYSQRFSLGGDPSLELNLFGLEFRGRGEATLEMTRVLEDGLLTFELSMEGILDGQPVVSYGPCTYELLPLWEVQVELAGKSSLELRERFLPSEDDLATGPAALLRAEVSLEGNRQSVTDYWRLVYTARRHNQDVRYWVVLEPPLKIASVGEAIHAVEIAAADARTGTEAEVNYLGAGFEVLASPAVLSFTKVMAHEPVEPTFRRGDVNADGALTAADAVGLLGYLFLDAEAPPCLKAADTNDSGRLNIGDSIAILRQLFGGETVLPQPFENCATDPTADNLSCQSYSLCSWPVVFGAPR